MLEAPARLWLNQARSDLIASQRILDQNDVGTFCQAMAKYQQVVEKSVKAIAAAVRDVGVNTINIGFTHDLEKIVSALVKLPHRDTITNVKEQIRHFLHERNRAEIKALCLLAPKRPGVGELARRNTEYPYQRPDQTWIAPHEDGAFTAIEVERFRKLSHSIIEGSTRIISAIERYPRSTS